MAFTEAQVKNLEVAMPPTAATCKNGYEGLAVPGDGFY